MNKTTELFSGCKKVDGVYILSELDSKFEDNYIELRKKENWIADNETLRSLPDVSKKNANYKLWMMRKDTAQRFSKYLTEKRTVNKILDLGCGNGWFSNMLAQHTHTEIVCGVDINFTELRQAVTVFRSKKLYWLYADIFQEELPKNFFDVITLNASFQYFSNAEITIQSLLALLKPDGEIHILDSPFYSLREKGKAKERSANYFTAQKSEGMANFYHHHSLEELKRFNYQIFYTPSKNCNRIKSFLGMYASPFVWVVISKAKN